MNDRSDPAEALLGLNSALLVPRPIHNAEGKNPVVDCISMQCSISYVSYANKEFILSSATSKRKYDDSVAVDAPHGCQLSRVGDHKEDLNSSLTCDIKPAAVGPDQNTYLSLRYMERAEAAMACIGSFLTTTEKALFGVAIDPTGPTRASEMVAGKNVTELDFGDVDAQLASRLTDDHLKCILVNIDAKDNLKVLKLTHCTGISGSGLEPLRDSCSMELIDLSLLKLHDPIGKWQVEEGVMKLKNDYSECLLSEYLVLPILDSLIEQGAHSALKYIQFHKSWKDRSSRQFKGVAARFKSFLNRESRNLCVLCNIISREGSTCYTCLEYVCSQCVCSVTPRDPITNLRAGSHCVTCDKSFCRRCVDFKQCQGDSCRGCNRNQCSECTTPCKTCKMRLCPKCRSTVETCDICGNEFCGDWASNCIGEHCRGCDKKICDSCSEFEFCWCGEAFCEKCNVEECKHSY